MGKIVIIGIVAGVVLGVSQSLVFSSEEGVARVISDVALAAIILGAIVGVIRAKWTALGKTVGLSTIAGLVLGALLGLRSGTLVQEAVQLGLTGLLLGVIVHIAAAKLSTPSPA